MSYQEKKDEVWNKAKTIRGKDPKKYRRDELGNEMYYDSYGKNSPMGWEIDHRKPKSKGGTDRLDNLRALNTRANRQKGNTYKK